MKKVLQTLLLILSVQGLIVIDILNNNNLYIVGSFYCGAIFGLTVCTIFDDIVKNKDNKK